MTQILESNFASRYGDILSFRDDSPRGSNLDILTHHDFRLSESMKQDSFCQEGHIFLSVLPAMFLRHIYPKQKDLKGWSCKLTISSVLTNEVVQFKLDLGSKVPNRQWVYGCLKSGRKLLTGVDVLIDNQLFDWDEAEERFAEKRERDHEHIPVTDIELELFLLKNRQSSDFLTLRHENCRSSVEYQDLENKVKTKYKFGLFEITENWTLLTSDSSPLYFENTYSVDVQAFSDAWLNNLGLESSVPLMARINRHGSANVEKVVLIHDENGMAGEVIQRRQTIRNFLDFSQGSYSVQTKSGQSFSAYFEGITSIKSGQLFSADIEGVTSIKKENNDNYPKFKLSAIPMFTNDFAFLNSSEMQKLGGGE